MNRRAIILRNQANHFHTLAMEAALAGNLKRSRFMAAEAGRAEEKANAIERHPSTKGRR